MQTRSKKFPDYEGEIIAAGGGGSG